MQRLAVRHSPPVLVAAVGVAVIAGYVGIRSFLDRELAAPRLSDSAVVAPHASHSGADPDLDGDGIADRFDGIFESCGAGGCAYEVYLRRPGGDAVYVGRMEGFWPFQIERLRDDEPADVIAIRRLGATESVGTRYRFADGRYRPFSESTCYREACTAEHVVHP